ncbi:Transcriptional regulator [Bosea sp. LC85]|uniref:GntR family transcriptional regulator n=1 Tax=Bosea sp. LC85 TaxID=1502851 RepID=UPI0004E45309|nr:GntR family transcriptional regulator [Bosea sp. LC85]KFC76074.1 Transcriptional regulator [Bosea sp. LC85]
MPPVNAKKATAPAAGLISGGSLASTLPNLVSLDSAPLYERVKRHMSEAILVGEWQPGMVLPNETALAQGFGIAVGTVRRAMSDLVAEGLLSRRRKTGTVVTGRAPHHSLRFFFQYFRLHRADGSLVRSTSQFLTVETRPATPEQDQRLQIKAGGVVAIHRIRHADGRPVMHDKLLLAEERVPDLPREPAELPPLLYLHLLERYGIRISAVREQITAELANDEDIALLDLAGPEAVLAIDEVAYDQAGVPTILGSHRASTRAHAYINEVR